MLNFCWCTLKKVFSKGEKFSFLELKWILLVLGKETLKSWAFILGDLAGFPNGVGPSGSFFMHHLILVNVTPFLMIFSISSDNNCQFLRLSCFIIYISAFLHNFLILQCIFWKSTIYCHTMLYYHTTYDLFPVMQTYGQFID